MKRRAFAAAAIVASAVVGAFLASVAAIGLVGVVTADSAAAYSPMPAVELVNHPSTAILRQSPRCKTPAPTTSAGYTKLFSQIPVAQWGGADVALSRALHDGTGRIAWLWGDTLRAGPMVHSSLIVQDKGCLHVSNGGAQLLPNDDAHHIYWINDAVATYGTSKATLQVEARSIILTGTCPWCFKDSGRSRWANVKVDANGDATFLGWAYWDDSHPGPAGNSDFKAIGPHHFTYGLRYHVDIRLADGNDLMTVCQNWDDGILRPFADYRPLFTG